MALNQWCAVLVVSLFTSSCARENPPAPPDEEPGTLSVTRWTAKTELFAEYPVLTVGQVSRFAIHLTQLEPFRALAEGQAEVVLRGGGSPEESFRALGYSRPGIFGVDVQPERAGVRDLIIRVRSARLEDEHRVGPVTVYADTAAARAAAAAGGEEAAPGISFLKEQQWTLDFGTALVTEATVRESARVPARVDARPGGAADVTSPIDGRLSRVTDVTPGMAVTAGQELARMLPPAASPGDLPQLERAVAEANAALALATRDRERAERLTTAGAAPGRRLDDARTVEEQAKARLAAAQGSLAQYNTSRAGGVSGGEGLFIVRAPIGGVIATRDATAGANVSAGVVLFRVVDPSQTYVVGQIPEADVTRARQAASAELDVPGRPQRVPLPHLVSVGKVIDPQTRTLPITFALDNRGLDIPVGQAVTLHLLMAEAPSRPVVPAAAVVDDAGRPIVFVQREGETFERRAVTTGARSGDVVQILDGVKPGERVVTRGAYLVRLASLSTSVPAHGHVH